MKRSELRSDPEKVRAFQQRGRESSARSLRNGSKPNGNGKPWGAPRLVRKAKHWREGRRKLLAEGFCRACGTVYHLQPHHIIFKSRSGTDDERNCLPLCATDHRRVHEHDLDVWPLLTDTERAYAVEQVGTEALAREQLIPSQSRKRAA